MKDPTAKTEWALSYCSECRVQWIFYRSKERIFRCMRCEEEKEIREVDRGRDGTLK